MANIPVPDAFVCSGVCGLHWDDRPSGRCLMCRDGDSQGWLCRGCHAGHARGRFPGHVATEAGARSDRGALLVELGTFAPPLLCTAHGSCAGGPLRHYCVTDGTSLCDACLVPGGSHTGHAIIPLARAAKACRSHVLLLTGGIGAWPEALPAVSFDDGGEAEHEGKSAEEWRSAEEDVAAAAAALRDQTAALRASCAAAEAAAEAAFGEVVAAAAARRDALVSRIREQGAAKAAALASELAQAKALMAAVEADSALAWRAVRSLTDGDVVGLHGVLEARIAEMFARLRAFAGRERTDPTLELHVSPAHALAAVAAMGGLATAAVGPGDVAVSVTCARGPLADGDHVSPGEAVAVALQLTPEAVERGASLAALALRSGGPAAASVRVSAAASVAPDGSSPGEAFEVPASLVAAAPAGLAAAAFPPQSPRSPAGADAASAAAAASPPFPIPAGPPSPGCQPPAAAPPASSPPAPSATALTFTFTVPRRLGALGGHVVVAGATLEGRAVSRGVPVRLTALPNGSLPAPLTLAGVASDSFSTPAVAPDGTLFVPNGRAAVHVVGADGVWRPTLDVAPHGLSLVCQAAVDQDPESGALTLALGSHDTGGAARLAAVDPATNALRWATPPGKAYCCTGLAVVPGQGLLVTASAVSQQICVYRLADGACLTAVASPTQYIYMAFDPLSGALFAGHYRAPRGVSAFQRRGTAVVPAGAVAAAGNGEHCRPLTVVPPAPGKRRAHLVVGTYKAAVLQVLSLPDLRLVHTHTLQGMQVFGLASDQAGTSLVVVDGACAATHLLPWPLPGMPYLP